MSHIPCFIGAILSACCVIAKLPELLMVGRFFTGINCGKLKNYQNKYVDVFNVSRSYTRLTHTLLKPVLWFTGFATQLAPMYLMEIVPFNLRGAFGTANQLFITIGIFMGSVFGLREILGKK